MSGHPRKLRISTVFVHLALIVLVIINLFPLYWMLTFSLKTNDEILGYSYVDETTGERVRVEPNHIGLPRQWEWSNYSEAMNTGNMGQYFLNSLVVAVSVIAIVITAVIFLFQKWASNRFAFNMNALHPIQRKKAKTLPAVFLPDLLQPLFPAGDQPDLPVLYSVLHNPADKFFSHTGGSSGNHCNSLHFILPFCRLLR